MLSEIEKKVLLFAAERRLVRRSELLALGPNGSAAQAAASLVNKKLLKQFSPLGETSYTPTQAGERLLRQLKTS